jgi:hypothetical protein
MQSKSRHNLARVNATQTDTIDIFWKKGNGNPFAMSASFQQEYANPFHAFFHKLREGMDSDVKEGRRRAGVILLSVAEEQSALASKDFTLEQKIDILERLLKTFTDMGADNNAGRCSKNLTDLKRTKLKQEEAEHLAKMDAERAQPAGEITGERIGANGVPPLQNVPSATSASGEHQAMPVIPEPPQLASAVAQAAPKPVPSSHIPTREEQLLAKARRLEGEVRGVIRPAAAANKYREAGAAYAELHMAEETARCEEGAVRMEALANEEATAK